MVVDSTRRHKVVAHMPEAREGGIIRLRPMRREEAACPMSYCAFRIDVIRSD